MADTNQINADGLAILDELAEVEASINHKLDANERAAGEEKLWSFIRALRCMERHTEGERRRGALQARRKALGYGGWTIQSDAHPECGPNACFVQRWRLAPDGEYVRFNPPIAGGAEVDGKCQCYCACDLFARVFVGNVPTCRSCTIESHMRTDENKLPIRGVRRCSDCHRTASHAIATIGAGPLWACPEHLTLKRAMRTHEPVEIKYLDPPIAGGSDDDYRDHFHRWRKSEDPVYTNEMIVFECIDCHMMQEIDHYTESEAPFDVASDAKIGFDTSAAEHGEVLPYVIEALFKEQYGVTLDDAKAIALHRANIQDAFQGFGVVLISQGLGSQHSYKCERCDVEGQWQDDYGTNRDLVSAHIRSKSHMLLDANTAPTGKIEIKISGSVGGIGWEETVEFEIPSFEIVRVCDICGIEDGEDVVEMHTTRFRVEASDESGRTITPNIPGLWIVHVRHIGPPIAGGSDDAVTWIQIANHWMRAAEWKANGNHFNASMNEWLDLAAILTAAIEADVMPNIVPKSQLPTG